MQMKTHPRLGGPLELEDMRPQVEELPWPDAPECGVYERPEHQLIDWHSTPKRMYGKAKIRKAKMSSLDFDQAGAGMGRTFRSIDQTTPNMCAWTDGALCWTKRSLGSL